MVKDLSHGDKDFTLIGYWYYDPEKDEKRIVESKELDVFKDVKIFRKINNDGGFTDRSNPTTGKNLIVINERVLNRLK